MDYWNMPLGFGRLKPTYSPIQFCYGMFQGRREMKRINNSYPLTENYLEPPLKCISLVTA